MQTADLYFLKRKSKILIDLLLVDLVALSVRFATIVSSSGAAASILFRLLSISGWNIAFAN
jgi:hypothetical protein